MADDRTDGDGAFLTDAQHSALTDELFAGWNALDPDAHHCFCGSDTDLIDAVQGVRERLADREPGDDR